MTTRAQKLRLGVFMLLALLILLGSIGTLAGLKMWNPRDRYTTRFDESISGLEIGSTVRMKGVRVGTVETIRIAEDATTVVVTLALDPGTPVKADTRAVVAAMGLTGLQFIELTGGSKAAPRLKPNTPKSTIVSELSTLQTLTGKAEDIAKKTEMVINNLIPLTAEENRTQVRLILQNTNKLLSAWSEIAGGDAPKRVQSILANLDRATAAMDKAARSLGKVATDNASRIASTLASAESASRAISRAVQGLRPQETLNEIEKGAKALRTRINDPAITQAMTSLSTASKELTTLSSTLNSTVRRRDRQLGAILDHLEDTIRNLKQFARSIRERPSLLLRGQTTKEREVP